MDEIRNCGDLDERLAPYVDGEATPEGRRSVEAHLAACPPCRKAADAESAVRTIVHEHRDRLHVEAPSALRARCAALAAPSAPAAAGRRSSIRRWMPLSLAATVLLAVAGVFLFGLNDRVEALAASLAIDHVKCFKTTNKEAWADSSAAAAHWQQDQGWPITVPQTEKDEQLRLVAVRRCFSTDGRAAHMMYIWRGAPLSVYVLQGDAGRDRMLEKMGRQEIIWCANQRTYAVVADGHPQDLTRIAAYMKSRVR